ncbi:MAG: Saccharopine dehydrogenase [bacterium]|nr:Saccharopine dehydrogenase [bacterium]
MKKNKILVIGGYGQVGQVICKDLAKIFPGRVIAAGRNIKKATEFSLTMKEAVIPLQFDAFKNHNNNSVLDDVMLLIMCLDQKDTRLVETCFKKGIQYIDISASYSFLSGIGDLDAHARKGKATGVLSVGLSPGLTNLLVKHSQSHFDKLKTVDIHLMLGLGDKHGKAAIEWTLDNMNSVFEIVENGSLKQVKGFEDGKKTVFPDKTGQRTTYRFDFADQHVVAKTLNLKSASTRFCFDSKFFTKTFAVLKRLGFFSLLKIHFMKSLFIKIFEKTQFGSDIFVVNVDSTGTKDGKTLKYNCSIRGREEAKITGKVASIVAEYVCKEKFPAGVYHIEQLFDPKDFIEKLDEYIQFQ